MTDEIPAPYTDKEETDDYPDHQLIPQKGGRYNEVLHGPPGTEIGDLPCELEPFMEDGRPFIVTHSGWRATPEQLVQLQAGAHLRMSVWQHPIPPLALGVEPPVCECHGQPMAWAVALGADSGHYYCDAAESLPLTPFDQAKEEFTPGSPESNDDD